MIPFALRAALSADAPAIADIYAHHVLTGTGTFELVPPDAAEIARRMGKVADWGGPWLVAEAGGRLMGYAYAGPFRERPAYARTAESSVYVAAGAERQGMGGALLAALVDGAAAAGFRQMVAVIGDSANHASIALHEAHGFRHAGRFEAVGFKFDRWLDVVLMQRSLGQ